MSETNGTNWAKGVAQNHTHVYEPTPNGRSEAQKALALSRVMRHMVEAVREAAEDAAAIGCEDAALLLDKAHEMAAQAESQVQERASAEWDEGRRQYQQAPAWLVARRHVIGPVSVLVPHSLHSSAEGAALARAALGPLANSEVARFEGGRRVH